ncbi:MAG: ribokinase [Limisphaerales bacterium]
MKAARRPTVAVVGSLNIDLVATVRRLPRPGETVAAGGIAKLFGGKGANQAVAAARQDVSVSFIGCVGGDADGRAYRQRMRAEGIEIGGIATNREAFTGTAIIGVDDRAENLIMVASEANGCVTPEMIRRHRRKIENASVLLLQFEVPSAAMLAAIRIANAAKVPTILNPSPFREDFPWGEVNLDMVIVNEGEAASLVGLKAGTIRRQARRWQAAMRAKNIGRLIVTRGKQSTLTRDVAGDFGEIETHLVQPVDTVGAGDAFAGSFAASLARGVAMDEAIRRANCAGALATLKPGAQESIPTLRAIRRFQRANA